MIYDIKNIDNIIANMYVLLRKNVLIDSNNRPMHIYLVTEIFILL